MPSLRSQSSRIQTLVEPSSDSLSYSYPYSIPQNVDPNSRKCLIWSIFQVGQSEQFLDKKSEEGIPPEHGLFWSIETALASLSEVPELA
jgi:hypothetical protein